jgi:hypothetical protein
MAKDCRLIVPPREPKKNTTNDMEKEEISIQHFCVNVHAMDGK